MQLFKQLSTYWKSIYPNQSFGLLEDFIEEIEKTKSEIQFPQHKKEWYKDAVVYSLYVDLFNKDFKGLIEKLDYLQDLGVNCLMVVTHS